MYLTSGFTFTQNRSVLFKIVLMVHIISGNVSSNKIEETCDVVKSLLQQYQAQCIFLLKPKDDPDMRTELISFKFVGEFSKKFVVSSMIRDTWKNSTSREMCQPFLFAFYNVSHADLVLKPFTETTFRANTKWILFKEVIGNEEQWFNNSFIPPDTEFLLAQPSTDKAAMIISELYQTQLCGNKPLGNGTLKKDLRGQISLARKDETTSKGMNSGLHFSPITDLQRIAHGGYGVPDANGSWNGMTGMLGNKSVDIGLMTLMLSNGRLNVLDYFVPLITSRFLIHLKSGETEVNSLDQLLKPLSDGLWIGVGSVIALASILLTVTWFSSDGRIHHSGGSDKFNLSNAILHVFGVFCQTGPGLASKFWPTRLVIINTYAIGFIVYVAYSATLFSFLAVRKNEMPFKGIKDLMDDGRYKLGLFANSAHFLLFRETKDPIMKEAYKKLVLAEKSHPTSIQDGLRRICDRKRYSYMMLEMFEEILRQDLGMSCSYVPLPQFALPAAMAIGCVKNSPLKRIINYHIIKMYEGGLLRLYRDRLVPLQFRTREENDVAIVASLEKVTTIFIVFLTGLVTSILMLLAEITLYRLKIKPEKTTV